MNRWEKCSSLNGTRGGRVPGRSTVTHQTFSDLIHQHQLIVILRRDAYRRHEEHEKHEKPGKSVEGISVERIALDLFRKKKKISKLIKRALKVKSPPSS